MSRFSIVEERVPLVWILVGLLFNSAGLYLGFEFGLLPSLGLQGQINPTSRKEEVDLRFGVLLHTPDRDQFARVLVRWDDPLFDEKNGVDAVGEQIATSTRIGGSTCTGLHDVACGIDLTTVLDAPLAR